MSQQWPPQQPGEGQPYDPYTQQPGQYGQYGPYTQPRQQGQTGEQPQWSQGGAGYPPAPTYPPSPYGSPTYPQGYPTGGYGAPPPYGMPPAPRQPRSRVGLIVGIIAVILVLGGGAAYALTRNGGTTTAATGTPTATPTTAPTATPAVATIYSSPLTGDVTGWPSRDGCAPAADGYHVKADVSCFAPTSNLTDFDLTVTGQAVGKDTSQPYGVTFRSAQAANDKIGDTYVVLIANSGNWALAKIVGGSATALGQSSSPSAAIHQDGSANTIEVKDRGTTITVLVNGTQIVSLSDSSLTNGLIGLQGYDGGEAVFTNLTITK